MNTVKPHDPAHAQYVDPDGRCLWCARLYLEVENAKLRADLASITAYVDTLIAQAREMESKTAKLCNSRDLRKQTAEELQKERNAALLQIDGLRNAIRRFCDIYHTSSIQYGARMRESVLELEMSVTEKPERSPYTPNLDYPGKPITPRFDCTCVPFGDVHQTDCAIKRDGL